MNKIFLRLFILLFIFNFSNNLVANDPELEWQEGDYESMMEFTEKVTLAVIYHEIGHLVIDEFNVPIFANEEDVADSFMSFMLIHVPEDYEDYESYEYWSEAPTKIIKGMFDYYFYKILLGIDTTSYYGVESEYGDHSTDNKRLFNIACFMKGANPELFESFISKRNFDTILEDKCNYNYWEMSDAWWELLGDNWEEDLDNYEQKIFLNFEDTNDEYILNFIDYSKKNIEDVLKNLQINLIETYSMNFRYCEGDINAYYISSRNEILVCYELIDYFMGLKGEVMLLRNIL